MSWRAEKPQPIDPDTAVAYADDKGWDAEWANMTPEQMVADMLSRSRVQKLLNALVNPLGAGSGPRLLEVL